MKQDNNVARSMKTIFEGLLIKMLKSITKMF